MWSPAGDGGLIDSSEETGEYEEEFEDGGGNSKIIMDGEKPGESKIISWGRGAEEDGTGSGRGTSEGIREPSAGCAGLVSATEVTGGSCTGEPRSSLRNSRYALSKNSLAKARARLFLHQFRAFFLHENVWEVGHADSLEPTEH